MQFSYNLILTVALEQEIPNVLYELGIPVVSLKSLLAGDFRQCKEEHTLCIITGVGKENSSKSAKWISYHCHPSAVINFGSTGNDTNLDFKIGDLITPDTFLSRDFCLDSLGTFPFLVESNIHHIDQLYSCINKDDCFKHSFIDMEAAFQAQIFFQKSIPFFCIKYVTDYNDEHVAKDFVSSLNGLKKRFSILFTEMFFFKEPEYISVIIPTYNRDYCLDRAIQSVLKQDFPTECIIVNDGSTDNSITVLKQYKDTIKTITLYKNEGVSIARNRGVDYASSDWIAFLDSDDEWTKNKLSNQIEFLKNFPYYSIVQSEEKWIRNGQFINKKKHHKKRSGFIWEDCLHRCMISPSSVLMRKALFKHYKGFSAECLACEDYDLWLKITRENMVGLENSVSLIKYGGHEDQLSQKYPIMDKFRVQSLKTLFHSEKNNFFKEKIKEVLLSKLRIIIQGMKKRYKHTNKYEDLLSEINE
tara:strand:- start:2993 stop:4411 length:1419 start_codon:yes stop_codon:yes gene_type:complete